MQHSTHRVPESGTILIIVLFCLTLLLTIGVLMILNSGTESLLNSNYRTSTQAFYAAMSGLEEARGRLSPRHPDSISGDRKSTRLNSSHGSSSYAVLCWKKK